MKWNIPKKGDERIKRKFAWLPTQVSETEKIWMQFYYVHQTYNVFRGWDGTWQGWSNKGILSRADVLRLKENVEKVL